MLKTASVWGERIAAVFPIIGHDETTDWRRPDGQPDIAECCVITTNEIDSFAVRWIGRSITPDPLVFNTFPAALRAARKACGWG